MSYNVPTVGFSTATWVPGTPAHSWQAIACGGTDMGAKGMIIAAKAIAGMGVDLLHDAKLVEYKALLGDRAPALNYRD